MPEVLAVIVARGGSKTIPRKNLMVIGGKPLIVWTIESAKGAHGISRTIVTTDDQEIASVSKANGVEIPFIRPSDLAADETSGVAPILHAVRWFDQHEGYYPDIVMSLQPTSPLRTSDDIDASLDLLESSCADTVVSVTDAYQNPYWMKTIDDKGFMRDFLQQQTPIIRRQELPSVYVLNGAVYLARRESLLKQESWHTARTAAYVMPFERSVDIDTALDVRFAELLMTKGAH